MSYKTSFVFNRSLLPVQDTAQGQFLNEVQLV